MRFQLIIVFKNNKQITLDVPDLTIAHSIRRSFNQQFIEDYYTSQLLVN